MRLNVGLGGLLGVVFRLSVVAVRGMSVMRSLLVTPSFMVSGCLIVVTGGVLVMLGGFAVMICCFLGHGCSSSEISDKAPKAYRTTHQASFAAIEMFGESFSLNLHRFRPG